MTTKMRTITVVLTSLIAVLLSACQPNAVILNSKPAAPSNAAPTDSGGGFDSFDKDLEAMRTADFDFIYVFRRKDGGVLTGADKKYLKANSPASTNRFVLSDADKAVVAGSKFKFSAENIAALESYFNVENYSKPETQNAPNANTNVRANQVN